MYVVDAGRFAVVSLENEIEVHHEAAVLINSSVSSQLNGDDTEIEQISDKIDDNDSEDPDYNQTDSSDNYDSDESTSESNVQSSDEGTIMSKTYS